MEPNQQRVLVVDDEPVIRQIMVRVLRRRYDVTAAESGVEAKQILEEDKDFRHIVCDLMMPIVSGIDLYDWLSEESPDLAQRMIMVTGGAFTSRANDFLERVPNRRLEKPFKPSELLEVLQG